MRDEPAVSGKKIAAIPDGAELLFLEETGAESTISGTTGRWTKVAWRENTGWVFGGFLAEKSRLGIAERIRDTTIVMGEKVQDGPLFFMRINGDHSFAALCQAGELVHAGGALREKFSGKWDAVEKSNGLTLRLVGKYTSMLFNPDPSIQEGEMQESNLEIALANDRLIFTMKNSQTHDSCFAVETDLNNYLWDVKNAEYFNVLMKSTYFPAGQSSALPAP